jgi:integrase
MQKPKKPFAEFPLFPHASKQWAKKIHGKLYYFGKWEDPDAAYQRYLDEWVTGRGTPTGVTIANLLDAFLGDKHARYQTGDMTTGSYKDFERVCDAIAAAINKHRPAETVTPEEFAELRVKLAQGPDGAYSPATLKRRLTMARMVFAYGTEEMGLKLRFKRQLNAPSQRTIRRRERNRAKRVYSSKDIRKLVKAADPYLRAMILLGINCGFGPTDCVMLPSDALDDGWHNYPRPKTEVDRRSRLWPETKKALAALKAGPRVFNGRRWDRHIIAREFGALCDKCGVTNHGFYSLRRTFETIATTAKVSQAAINHVMGHSENDMGSVYRQEIFDRELTECAEHVRQWYLGKIQL